MPLPVLLIKPERTCDIFIYGIFCQGIFYIHETPHGGIRAAVFVCRQMSLCGRSRSYTRRLYKTSLKGGSRPKVEVQCTDLNVWNIARIKTFYLPD